MFRYKKVEKQKKKKNKQTKCLVILFHYTQIDSTIFNLQTHRLLHAII